ncbi:MAG: stage II sporulation protein M [Eubacterium sp.]|nr:stage II sporulation protein M [Eubacterium sp.]
MANTVWKNEASWIGYLHESSFISGTPDLESGGDNLFAVIISRMPMWILLIVFGRTGFGLLVGQGFVAWQGFSLGFILSSFLIRYGILGIVVFFMTCLPQMVLYGVAYGILLFLLCKLHRQKKQAMILGEYYDELSRKQNRYIGVCFVLTTLFCVGIFLESYVNVWLLEKIPRIISIV